MLARPRFQCLTLCCFLVAACGTLLATERGTDLPGIYQGHAPAADAAQRVFTLKLVADGSATWTTQFIGKGKAAERARWVQSGRELILTFEAMGSNRPPRPITFRHRGHKLSPVNWDSSEWGRAGPPVLYRTHAQADL
jgi:hypothetical protein